MNLDETAELVSQGLPHWQKLANRNFLESVWVTLKVGGHWAYPATLQLFEKTEEGFELVVDDG